MSSLHDWLNWISTALRCFEDLPWDYFERTCFKRPLRNLPGCLPTIFLNASLCPLTHLHEIKFQRVWAAGASWMGFDFAVLLKASSLHPRALRVRVRVGVWGWVCVCTCTIQSISQGDSNSSPYWTLKLFRTWKPPSMIWLFNCRQALGSLHAQVMRDTCPQSIVGKQSETNRLEAEGKHDAEKGPTTAEVVKLMEWIGMIYWQIISFDWAGGCGKVWGQVVGQGMAARNLQKHGQITRSWHKRHHETIWKMLRKMGFVSFCL